MPTARWNIRCWLPKFKTAKAIWTITKLPCKSCLLNCRLSVCEQCVPYVTSCRHFEGISKLLFTVSTNKFKDMAFGNDSCNIQEDLDLVCCWRFLLIKMVNKFVYLECRIVEQTVNKLKEASRPSFGEASKSFGCLRQSISKPKICQYIQSKQSISDNCSTSNPLRYHRVR